MVYFQTGEKTKTNDDVKTFNLNIQNAASNVTKDILINLVTKVDDSTNCTLMSKSYSSIYTETLLGIVPQNFDLLDNKSLALNFTIGQTTTNTS